MNFLNILVCLMLASLSVLLGFELVSDNIPHRREIVAFCLGVFISSVMSFFVIDRIVAEFSDIVFNF